jgi:hypothetical protein
MGYIEVFNENDGSWENINDIPHIESINCQLCNEPTLAKDVIAHILIKDEVVSVGSWQCRKCHAVNG